MRTFFIFNPQSGHNRRRPGLATAIRGFIATRAIDAEFAVTDGPGHATELARSAAASGVAVVVAVGGDGTMNEVAQGLIGTPTALALVPCGSGNGLALHLGIPRSPFAALTLAVAPGGRVAAIDSGEVNGRPFFNAMGLGLDAEVSRRFNRLTRRGLPAYVRVAWEVWRQRRPVRCIISGAGSRETLDVLLLTIANSDQYGNHARIAPGARVDDGRLDLVAIRPVGLVGSVALGTRLFLGTLDRSFYAWRCSAEHFTIERDAPGLIHTDGETHEAGVRLEVAVRPRSLRMVVPARCRAVASAPESAASRFALHLP